MTAQEIILYGYNQRQPEEPLNMAAQLLWFQMALLRTNVESGKVPLDRASELKQEYMTAYNRNDTQLYFDRKIRLNHADMYKQLEYFISSYRMEHKGEEPEPNVEALIYVLNGHWEKIPNEEQITART